MREGLGTRLLDSFCSNLDTKFVVLEMCNIEYFCFAYLSLYRKENSVSSCWTKQKASQHKKENTTIPTVQQNSQKKFD